MVYEIAFDGWQHNKRIMLTNQLDNFEQIISDSRMIVLLHYKKMMLD